MSALPPLNSTTLPAGVKFRFIDNVNDLRMHILETGDGDDRPLHGFPELAYMWRTVIIPFAEQSYHVIASDQRGYGRTTSSNDRNNNDLTPFSMLNMCQGIVTLLYRLAVM